MVKKFHLEQTMSWLEKPLAKILFNKDRKTLKIKVKLPHVNDKTISEETIFGPNLIFALQK